MKNSSLILLFCLLATGFSIAQQSADSNKEVLIGNPNTETTIPTQRHPTSDLVLRIRNKNEDKLPVVIRYHDEKETGIYVKELQTELVIQGLNTTLQPSADAMPAADNPKHYNCIYQITDSSFIITAYPQVQ